MFPSTFGQDFIAVDIAIFFAATTLTYKICINLHTNYRVSINLILFHNRQYSSVNIFPQTTKTPGFAMFYENIA